MDDKMLYQTILGLPAPWLVTEVEIKPAKEVVEVSVSSSQRQWPCPVCETLCSQYETRPRRWRHLDSCQYQTILVASVPRVRCRHHGVKQVPVPWADPGSGFTVSLRQACVAPKKSKPRVGGSSGSAARGSV